MAEEGVLAVEGFRKQLPHPHHRLLKHRMPLLHRLHRQLLRIKRVQYLKLIPMTLPWREFHLRLIQIQLHQMLLLFHFFTRRALSGTAA